MGEGISLSDWARCGKVPGCFLTAHVCLPSRRFAASQDETQAPAEGSLGFSLKFCRLLAVQMRLPMEQLLTMRRGLRLSWKGLFESEG